jgi:hypothetical protein
MAVKRSGVHRHLSTGLFADGLHHAIAVALAIRQRQKNVEHDWMHHFGYIQK